MNEQMECSMLASTISAWTKGRIAQRVRVDADKFEADLEAWLRQRGIDGINLDQITSASVSAYRLTRRNEIESVLWNVAIRELDRLLGEALGDRGAG